MAVWVVQPHPLGGEDPDSERSEQHRAWPCPGRGNCPVCSAVIEEHAVKVGDAWTKAKPVLNLTLPRGKDVLGKVPPCVAAVAASLLCCSPKPRRVLSGRFLYPQ